MYKFNSKTQNKGTKTKTQRLKTRTRSVQNQSINKYLLRWSKNVNMKRIEQGYGVRLYLKMIKFKVMGPYFDFYPFGDLIKRSFYGGFHLLIN